jgi:hypothetical protein
MDLRIAPGRLWRILTKAGDRSGLKACCTMSRRDGAIVAWHEVPGTGHPKRAVP